MEGQSAAICNQALAGQVGEERFQLEALEKTGADDWNRTSDLRFTKFRKSTSDNLYPQEATKPDAPDMGLDGAEWSCPWQQRGSRKGWHTTYDPLKKISSLTRLRVN